MLVTIVDHLARTLEVLHKSAMGEGVDVSLRSLVRNGENEVCGVFNFRHCVVLAYQIEITAACRINVMDHAACLSRVLLDA